VHFVSLEYTSTVLQHSDVQYGALLEASQHANSDVAVAYTLLHSFASGAITHQQYAAPRHAILLK
jgi:hypothetical protein